MLRRISIFLTLLFSLISGLDASVTEYSFGNGATTTTSFDKLGRTQVITERDSSSAIISAFDYSQSGSYDAVGNVLRCAETYSRAGMINRVVTNTYDNSYRLLTETLTPASGTATVTTYGYDKANNRTSKTVGTATTAYVFGNGSNGANSNQLISYGPSGQAATHTFTYDANGNRKTRVTAAGTESLTWDHDDRLVSLTTSSGATYSYVYDYRTRRVIRDESAAGGVKSVLCFSGGTGVQEANAAGVVQAEFIRGSDWGGGIGGVLYSVRGENFSFNAYNSRGDVVSTTDATGASTWQASYEAFGTRTEEDGANNERQRANTKDEDPTGLLNEGNRYRDLEAGVFISRDPLGFVDGPNLYAYVRQNPWTKFDPLGLQSWALPSGYAQSAEYREGFQRGAGAAFVAGTAITVGVAATVWTSGAAGPYVASAASSLGLSSTTAAVTTAAVAGASGGAASQMTSNVLTGQSVMGNVPEAAATGAVLNMGGAVLGQTIQGLNLGIREGTAIATAKQLATQTAASGAPGGAASAMVTAEGQIFTGLSKNAGGGAVSPAVSGLYGSARTTCAEARVLTAMEQAGASPQGAVSASASVNIPLKPVGTPMPACRQACAPVLKNAGIGDAVAGTSPTLATVRPAVPVPPTTEDEKK